MVRAEGARLGLAHAAAIEPHATPALADERLIDQRRREFFLDGHHLGDVQRYALTLQPPAGDMFQGGGVYGSQVCLPLPEVERLNNPNL